MEQIRPGGIPDITRRAFLVAGASATAALACSLRRGIEPVAAKSAPKEVRIVQFSPAGQRLNAVMLPVIVKSGNEWQ
jgi:hypothetical protein